MKTLISGVLRTCLSLIRCVELSGELRDHIPVFALGMFLKISSQFSESLFISIEFEEKKATTDALIVSIGQEKAIVDEAVENSSADEEACSKIAEEVMAFQAECAEDLKAAEPIIQQAEAALNSLDKASKAVIEKAVCDKSGFELLIGQ